jgi:DNA modification methylase
MVELLHGDCLERLQELPDCSVDACVTDPPYGLSFMGKKWDYDVPGENIWRECLRVLKPGGHLLAFAGTRTQHRMAVRIEDAGFEIRDMIAWVYGSGFPKSLDVSKAIDKTAPRRGQFDAFAEHFDAMWRISGLKRSEFVPYFPHYKNAASVIAQLSNWKLAKNVPTKQDFLILQELLGLSDEFAVLIDRVEAKREVVGQKAAGIARPGERDRHTIGTSGTVVVDITAPATPEAQQWDGWGTALKPALEPITVARKPLQGTVAANVLEHGTGAINIDGCRVGTDGGGGNGLGSHYDRLGNTKPLVRHGEASGPIGRWPANLIHDGSDEVTELLGDAQRFFYCAKASKKDRSEGNTHPTVKPTDLMRYLCRLVTPPGGIVLDPFMGSGSTGKAAMLDGFRFIGIERDPTYFESARRRLQMTAHHQEDLF